MKMKGSNMLRAFLGLPAPTEKKVIVCRGGTRAGKTYSMMQVACQWLLTGKVTDSFKLLSGTWDVVRKTLPALKESALDDFHEMITPYIVAGWVNFEAVKLRYTLRQRDPKTKQLRVRRIRFYSLDSEQKIRGRKRDLLFCNEVNDLEYKKEFFQLILRTKYYIFVDFNPSDPYTWIKSELEERRANTMGDVLTIKSTYLDNPFLDESLVREIEAIEDPQLQQVYRYGEYGLVKGLVFPKMKVVSRLPDGLKKVGVGLDFGFTNDPTAALICGQLGDTLYFRELLYDYALTSEDIAQVLKPYQLPIVADSADPKTIEELSRLGLNIRPAAKGPDSIRNGIALLKRYKLAATADSDGLLMEQKKYKYDDKARGAKRNNPLDKDNHAFDAIRYWAQFFLKRDDGPSIIG